MMRMRMEIWKKDIDDTMEKFGNSEIRIMLNHSLQTPVGVLSIPNRDTARSVSSFARRQRLMCCAHKIKS